MVLRLFLRDIKWAGIGALIVWLLCEGLGFIKYAYDKDTLERQIELYQSFILKPDDSRASDIAALLQDSALNSQQRTTLLHLIISKAIGKDTILSQISKLDPSIFMILLTDRARTNDLIQTTQKELAEIRFDWTWQFWYAYYALIWASSVCLLFHWVFSGNLRIIYFPVKYWWFYIYLILAFPASLLLPTFILPALGIKYLIHRMRKQKNKEVKVPSYEKVYAAIRAEQDEIKKNWVDLFSASRLDQLYNKHIIRLLDIKNALQNMGRELQTKNREYFHEKEQIELLREDVKNKETIADLAEEGWTDLTSNPLIKALDVKKNTIEIYTDYLPHPLRGVVGPFKIIINTDHRPFKLDNILLAHENGVTHPQGAGTGQHCFGNVNGLIQKLLGEYRIEAATGVMLKAFQSTSI